MKKFLTIACIFICALMLFACADKPAAATIDVYVTIANAGTLVVKQEKITVTDLNGDKKFNIDETLAAAHAAKDKSADYASAVGQYGLGVTKMWGDTSGWFSYYVNDVSPQSLADEVKEGDYVSAFVFKDKEYGSDSYSYFNARNLTVKKGETFDLSLQFYGYDENWNTVVNPAANASIVINGVTSSNKTDENGAVTLSFDEAGTYVLSAVGETLVPAVCIVTVK